MLRGIMGSPTTEVDTPDTRARILEAAARLVANGGVAALTTRAVASAASVQAPTLYRLFGDKRGLLDAVAEHGLAAFVAGKVASPPNPDPVQDLCEAWDAFVAFGLANPAVFAIMNEVGRPGAPSPAALAGMAVLRERVRRIARAGRLRVPEERALLLIHAAGVGTVSTLLGMAELDRDPALSPLARKALLAVLINDRDVQAADNAAALAVGLRSHLDDADALTPGERMLLGELLDRLAGPRP